MRKSLHNIEIWGGRSISGGRMRLTILPRIFDFIQLTCKSTSWVLPDDIKKIVEKLPSLDAIFDLNFTEQTRLFDYLFIALWIDEEKENISQIISLDMWKHKTTVCWKTPSEALVDLRLKFGWVREDIVDLLAKRPDLAKELTMYTRESLDKSWESLVTERLNPNSLNKFSKTNIVFLLSLSQDHIMNYLDKNAYQKELKTHPEDINNDKYFQLYRFNAAHSSHMETLILLFSLTDFTEITSSQIERLYNLEGRHLNMLFNNIEAHYIPGQTTTLSKANMLKAAITADDKDFQSIIDAIAQNQATKML